MIHDLDAILSVVPSGVKKISASGVAVVSDTPDIANARIEFDNGCVANLTASRISMKNMRKSRFFQKDAYISVDFLTKKVLFDKPDIEDLNAIKEELSTFGDAVIKDTAPIVSIEDGYNALDIAQRIVDQLKSTSSPVFNNK